MDSLFIRASLLFHDSAKWELRFEVNENFDVEQDHILYNCWVYVNDWRFYLERNIRLEHSISMLECQAIIEIAREKYNQYLTSMNLKTI